MSKDFKGTIKLDVRDSKADWSPYELPKAHGVQFCRLSDLSLLKSVALPTGPRGDGHDFTGKPRLLPDGQSVYVHTFNCGRYQPERT